ncbi:MAG TPA: hypothetical protein VL358_13865 [Caulobacteraceae bacterium]|jgi:hypothetical protein|nr:hypothetical protein [Caulobacteraceae bacterium]
MLSRHALLRQGLDFDRMVGAEIGPLCSPVISKAEGKVIYIDWADTATLVDRYKNDPNVDTTRIVHVDAIWGGQPLLECLNGQKVDYLIASHVAEHVPDLITWLQEVRAGLNEGGELRLVLPDRRFSFDYLRAPTDVSDLLAAYAVRARRPQLREVIDFQLYAQPKIDSWKFYTGEHGREDVIPHHAFGDPLESARKLLLDPSLYIDVHCWVFHPREFARLMVPLAKNGLIELACAGFVDTRPEAGFEFHVHLTPCADRKAAARSWEELAEQAQDPLPGSAAARAAQLGPKAVADLENAQLQIAGLESELAAARKALAEIHAASTWRAMAPIRAIVGFARRVLN